MKMKHKALSLLLALAMMITYMPAIAFAQGDVSGAAGSDNKSAAAGQETAGSEGNAVGEASFDEKDIDEVQQTIDKSDLNVKEDAVENKTETQQPLLKGAMNTLENEDEGDDFWEGVGFFELDGPDRVFDDGDTVYKLTDEEALNYEGVEYREGFVGIPGPDGWEAIGADVFNYDDNTKTLTVHGDKIAAHYNNDEAPETIGVEIVGYGPDGEDEDKEDDILFIAGSNDIEFCYSYLDYGLPEDRTILPYWNGNIDGEFWGYREDSEKPDGEDFPVTVTNVVIKEGEKLLREFEKYEDNNGEYGWNYRAGTSYGDVVFDITYKDLDNREQHHELTVTIAGDVYNAGIESKGNIGTGLPGSSIELTAWAEHKYMENGDEQYSREGLNFRWSLESGKALAEIIQDKNNPEKATLTFKPLADGEKDLYAGCRVKLTVTDNKSEDKEMVRATETRWFNIRTEYDQILPAELNSDLMIGGTISNQQFEVRHYSYWAQSSQGYEADKSRTVKDVSFSWDYDKKALSITGSKSIWSITRIGDYETGAELTAKWTEGEGAEEKQYTERQSYWFADSRPEFWLAKGQDHDVDVYSDAVENPQIRFDLEQFGDKEEAESLFNFVYEAGEWDDDNKKWTKTLTPGTDFTVARDTVNPDVAVVTFDRSKLNDKDFEDEKDIRLQLTVTSKTEGVYYLDDEDAWLHLKMARTEYDIPEHVDLLPGWHFWIGDTINVKRWDSDNPEGKDSKLNINKVAVMQSDGVIELTDDNKKVVAKKYGHATVTISHDAYHGSDSRTIKVNVSDKVYRLDMWSEDNIYEALPGSSITLCSQGRKEFVDESDPDNPYIETDYDCFNYSWSVIEGERYASVVPVSGDPSTAVVAFAERPDTDEFFNEKVRIKVQITDKSDNSDRVVGERDIELHVSDAFEQIWPSTLAENPWIGETFTIEPELHHYDIELENDDKYYVIEEADFSIDDDYDKNALVITETENVFTITRKNAGETDFRIVAGWTDEDGREKDADIEYRLDALSLGECSIAIGDDDNEQIKLFAEEGQNIAPIPTITLKRGNNVIDRKEYNYEIGKLDFDENNQPVYEEVDLTEGTLSHGANGSQRYVVTVFPSEGSDFDGTVRKLFYVCSDKCISPQGPEVLFAGGAKYFVDPYNSGEEPFEGWQGEYIIPRGISLSPSVTLNGGKLAAGTDFTCEFAEIKDIGLSCEDIEALEAEGKLSYSTSFPVKTGKYLCIIKGTKTKGSGYYGKSRILRFEITDNPNISTAQALIDALNTANPDAAAVDAARKAYDRLSASEKALVDISKLTASETRLKQIEKAKADAEAEAARQAALAAEYDWLDWEGTLSTAIPAAKSVKTTAAKKKATVRWGKLDKKKLKSFDFVEIQACPNRGFQRADTIRVTVKKSKASATIKKLTTKQTYYIRVRNVKGNGVTKIVSKWSKVKKVKIK